MKDQVNEIEEAVDELRRKQGTMVTDQERRLWNQASDRSLSIEKDLNAFGLERSKQDI